MKIQHPYKTRVLEAMRIHITQQINACQKAISSVIESKNNETKSSVGDKYETGRAMMQMEQEKYERQLLQKIQLKNKLGQIRSDAVYNSVEPGALVISNNGVFFVGIGLGKIIIEDKVIYAISHDAPLGKALIGKNVGDKFMFYEQEYSIHSIC